MVSRAAALAERVSGTVFFLGASDTGKTTLARALLAELEARGHHVAFLDCDPGQTTVGPPATLGVRWRGPDGNDETRLYFVGSTSPRGHFLPMVLGSKALLQEALEAGNDTVLVDTSGLVDPAAGGVALKLWKCEALQPDYVVALQREDELRPILRGLRRRYRQRLFTLTVEPEARQRGRDERVTYRRERWTRYFAHCHELSLNLAQLDVWGGRRLEASRLLGLDGQSGLCLGLAVVTEVQPGMALVLTPLQDVASVARVRVGALRLDRNWSEWHG
ncbi:MAG: hypothetical protein HPY83_14910 [Anaerolineae bacterium]|nr:hypothetical protein [Anaerolineae bacterium]